MIDYSVDVKDKPSAEAARIHPDNIDEFLADLRVKLLSCDNFEHTAESIEVKKGEYRESVCVQTIIRFTN